MIPSADIIHYMNNQAFFDSSIPHGVSHPVIRKENNLYYIAAYVTYFNSKNLYSGKFPRPTAWMIADIETGILEGIFHCEDHEFSDAGYGSDIYDLNYSSISQGRARYYSHLFELLDEVRKEIILENKFRIELYREYLELLTKQEPPCYRRFHRELSI